MCISCAKTAKNEGFCHFLEFGVSDRLDIANCGSPNFFQHVEMVGLLQGGQRPVLENFSMGNSKNDFDLILHNLILQNGPDYSIITSLMCCIINYP